MAADAFAPARLGSLALRNRVIKTATYEGMCPGGVPSAQLVEHHRALAAGGVGDDDGRLLLRLGRRPHLRGADVHAAGGDRAAAPVTDAVHREGGAASLQLGHCGWFTKNPELSTRLPRGPSLTFNAYGLSAGKPVARRDERGRDRRA